MKFEVTGTLTKQIEEMRYLAVENTWRYRSILRYFYVQSEKMKNWLYKEEVFAALKANDEFINYSIEQCQQDLEILLGWKNLSAYQDTAKVTTVAEFKNKKFRYQLTPYSVEIERLTLRLENLKVESASLEPTLLERLREAIKKLPAMAGQPEKEVGGWWHTLSEDFKRLNQNYLDYIRDLYSIKAEELMQTEAFMVFKDRFIEYLRDFVKGLQSHATAIDAILRAFNPEDVDAVLNKAIAYEVLIPRMETEIDKDAIRENIMGQWQSLSVWFCGEGGTASEAVKLLDMTNDIIRKITRYAVSISESRSSALNRKEEYRKLATLFDACDDISEAHRLSAMAFGIFRMKHLKSDQVRETESINSQIFEEAAGVVKLKPRIRSYREKAQRNPIRSNQEKKAAMRQKIEAQRQFEENTLAAYMIDDCIEFEKLPVIEAHVRNTLLKWLSKAMGSKKRVGKTEDGRLYQIDEPENGRRCLLSCLDGNFEMPAYVIRFVKPQKEARSEGT